MFERRAWHGPSALIGDTGYVGGNLVGQMGFDRAYNSRTIAQIAGERFDLVVCAGVRAAMWAANGDPAADLAGIHALEEALATAHVGVLVHISTTYVLDDVSAGYVESTARYEEAKAYGRHRRELEVRLQERYGATVIRLPALFGPGLRKNFVFDLMNPAPGFLRPAAWARIEGDASAPTLGVFRRAYAWDEALQVHRLDREVFAGLDGRGEAERELRDLGLAATSFTNGASRFQYYDIGRLAGDIGRCLDAGLGVAHLCPEGVRASEVAEVLTGAPFVNGGPAAVDEDVRTEHAAILGGAGGYLYGRDDVFARLRAYRDGGRP